MWTVEQPALFEFGRTMAMSIVSLELLMLDFLWMCVCDHLHRFVPKFRRSVDDIKFVIEKKNKRKTDRISPDDVVPSPCVDRMIHNIGLNCNRNRFHSPCDHNSSMYFEPGVINVRYSLQKRICDNLNGNVYIGTNSKHIE